MPKRRHPNTFVRFARATAAALGHPAAFGAAAAIVLVWLCLGPVFGYSDTWQMVINTATTIVTFLMVFLIQNTQNRQDDGLQLKLDELIRALGGAHNRLVDLEDVPDEELREIKERFHRLAETSRRQAEASRTPNRRRSTPIPRRHRMPFARCGPARKTDHAVAGAGVGAELTRCRRGGRRHRRARGGCSPAR